MDSQMVNHAGAELQPTFFAREQLGGQVDAHPESRVAVAARQRCMLQAHCRFGQCQKLRQRQRAIRVFVQPVWQIQPQ